MIKCTECKEEIRPGEHVYPGKGGAWHTKCERGMSSAVMGSDGKIRWLYSQREWASQKKWEERKNESL